MLGCRCHRLKGWRWKGPDRSRRLHPTGAPPLGPYTRSTLGGSLFPIPIGFGRKERHSHADIAGKNLCGRGWGGVAGWVVTVGKPVRAKELPRRHLHHARCGRAVPLQK